MRVLGLDPGSRTTGYGCLDVEGRRSSLVGHGEIALSKSSPLPDRLAELALGTAALVDELSPDVAVLETTFVGLNPKSLITLSQARGAIVATLARREIAIEEISPAEVKSAVTGNGRADKEQVARMVRMLLGLGDARVAEDASDALAVALCFAARHPTKRAVERAVGKDRAANTPE